MLASRLSPLREVRWSRIRDLFRFGMRRLREGHLPQVAGSLTFATVLALVPLLTIALAIFTAFPLFDTMRAALQTYFTENLMPKAVANTVIGYLNQFASKSMRLSAVGGIVLFVTAVSMMLMIERVFNQIWQVKTARPIGQRIMVYWAILTLGPVLIGLSIRLTSFMFTATNDVVSGVPVLGAVLYTAVSILLTTGAFTLLYVSVPNRSVDWRDAAWGGLLAGVAFEIAKRLFAAYITKFPTYTMVYGTVAAVPIFLLWVYMLWMITLVGALFAAALPVVKFERWWHEATPGSAFVDAMAVLKVLYEARAAGASAAIDATMIRGHTRIGFEESERLLQAMLEAGWVGRVKAELPRRFNWGRRSAEGMDCWTLLVNPAQVRVADVYRLFVFTMAGDVVLARQVEEAVERGLGQSLDAHFGAEQGAPAR